MIPPVHTDWLEGLSLFQLWVEGEGWIEGCGSQPVLSAAQTWPIFLFFVGKLAHSIPLPTSFVICNSWLDLSGPGLWDHLGHIFFSLRLVREEMENHHGLLLFFFPFLHFYLPLKEEAPRGDEVIIILLLQ